MLTVNNLTGNVSFARGMVNTQTGTHYFRKGGRTLSFLPLAHAYGCAFDFLSPLAVGGTSPCWVRSRPQRSCWKPCPWSSRRSSAAYR